MCESLPIFTSSLLPILNRQNNELYISSRMEESHVIGIAHILLREFDHPVLYRNTSEKDT